MRKSWFSGIVLGGAVVGVVVVGLGAADTAPPAPVPWLVAPLVRQLAARGITDQNTSRIVVIGNEGGYGSDFKITIGPHYLIQKIWDTIYQSRPYKTIVFSGYRTLKFYKKGDSRAPVVELLVNATGRCHIHDSFDNGYRCPGINKLLKRLLKSRYEY